MSSTPDVQLRQRRRDRGAGDGQLHRGGAVAAHRCDQRGRATMVTAAPANANQRYDDRSETPNTEIASDHRERGAGVDAEDPGVGQRVAGEPLHAGAGEPERGADGQAQAGARRAGRRRSACSRVGRCRGRRSARSSSTPPAPRAPTRPAPRRREAQPRCWSAYGRLWRAVRTPSRGRSSGHQPSAAVDRLGDLGQEVLDGERDRQRARVGHREADVLVRLGVRVPALDGRDLPQQRVVGERLTGRRGSRRTSAGRRTPGSAARSAETVP